MWGPRRRVQPLPGATASVPPDGGIREAPIVPGPTPASPWTNTPRLAGQDEGGKAATTPPDREFKPLLGPCTPTTNKPQDQDTSRPYKWTQKPDRRTPHPGGEARDDRQYQHANGFPPSLLHVSSSRETKRPGSLRRINQATYSQLQRERPLTRRS